MHTDIFEYGQLYLSDGGLETDLIFNDGIALEHFAAFPLVTTAQGRAALGRYYDRYIAIAREVGMGFILETPTWRASADWGAKLGFSQDALAVVNREAVMLLNDIQTAHAREVVPFILSGNIGPRGDGYEPGRLMTAAEAQDFHGHQIAALAEAGAEIVTAMTMTNTGEASGIARAAAAVGLPAVISFTVETDGRLPTGETLSDAIAAVDAAPDAKPLHYMVNCAHPTHFEDALSQAPWMARVRGIRANASRRSHKELDEATELDAGDPVELGGQYRALKARLPHLTVFGGCCGTDHRHIGCIGHALRPSKLDD